MVTFLYNLHLTYNIEESRQSITTYLSWVRNKTFLTNITQLTHNLTQQISYIDLVVCIRHQVPIASELLEPCRTAFALSDLHFHTCTFRYSEFAGSLNFASLPVSG